MGDNILICIRCGSKEHSTRDHDEGKVKNPATASVATSSKKQKGNAAAVGAASRPKTAVQHTKCWQGTNAGCGIPEIFEKPDPRGRYTDPEGYHWTCRKDCTCDVCQKKRKYGEMNRSERKKVYLGTPITATSIDWQIKKRQ